MAAARRGASFRAPALRAALRDGEQLRRILWGVTGSSLEEWSLRTLLIRRKQGLPFAAFPRGVIPAQAGIQVGSGTGLDSRFRGNDECEGLCPWVPRYRSC